MLNTNEVPEVKVIEVLKTEAKKNPVANAVFHVLAMRQRARQTLTINGLAQRMKAEGFDFKNDQYTPVLKLLADLGFGKLQINPKGKIQALKDIRKTLQSIGLAACGTETKMTGFKPRAKFSRVVVKQDAKLTPTQEIEDKNVFPGLPIDKDRISISLFFHGKPIEIALPKDLSSEELAKILEGVSTLKAV